jgi:hypothetical protein
MHDVMIEAASHPEKYTEELNMNGYMPDGFRQNDGTPWVMEPSPIH